MKDTIRFVIKITHLFRIEIFSLRYFVHYVRINKIKSKNKSDHKLYTYYN